MNVLVMMELEKGFDCIRRLPEPSTLKPSNSLNIKALRILLRLWQIYSFYNKFTYIYVTKSFTLKREGQKEEG